MAKRILFTGGTGKAGRHMLPWLLGRGYRIGMKTRSNVIVVRG